MYETILLSLIALAVALPLLGVSFGRVGGTILGAAILLFWILWLFGSLGLGHL